LFLGGCIFSPQSTAAMRSATEQFGRLRRKQRRPCESGLGRIRRGRGQGRQVRCGNCQVRPNARSAKASCTAVRNQNQESKFRRLRRIRNAEPRTPVPVTVPVTVAAVLRRLPSSTRRSVHAYYASSSKIIVLLSGIRLGSNALVHESNVSMLAVGYPI
jgi:hypothetical protein